MTVCGSCVRACVRACVRVRACDEADYKFNEQVFIIFIVYCTHVCISFSD